MTDVSANPRDVRASSGSRVVRVVGTSLAWVIWVVAGALSIFTNISQVWLLTLVAFGFVPYLLSVHVVEPWIRRGMLQR